LNTERQTEVNLNELCTWRIGGKARLVCFPASLKELSRCIGELSQEHGHYFTVGRGSNILFSSSGVEIPLVVTTRLTAAGFLNGDTAAQVFAPVVERLPSPDGLLFAEAGVPNARLIELSLERGRGDLTCLTGVPGSFAGAIAMNAQNIMEELAGRLWLATLNRASGACTVREGSDFAYNYRFCQAAETVLGAVLVRLLPADSGAMRAKVKERNEKRARTLPLEWPSAGCVFRNPPGEHAGVLLDRAGMKGQRCGGAAYSEKHANFILNYGEATSEDVVELMVLGKRAVWERFGRCLIPEIKFVGEFDPQKLAYLHADLERGDG